MKSQQLRIYANIEGLRQSGQNVAEQPVIRILQVANSRGQIATLHELSSKMQ